MTFTDTFSEADSTNLHGKATTTGGGVWTVQNGSLDVFGGQGRVTAGSGSSWATIAAGFVNIDMSVTITSGAGAIDGLIFRVLDAANYLRVDIDNSGDLLKLIKNVAGVETTVAQVSIPGLAVGQTAVYRVLCLGPSVKVYAGGTLRIDTTVTEHQTETKHGIIGYSTNTRFDDFSLADNRAGIVLGPGTYGGSAYGTAPYGGGTGAVAAAGGSEESGSANASGESSTWSVTGKAGAWQYIYENVGGNFVPGDIASVYTYQSIGANIPNSEIGCSYIYEGDVDSSIPIPHIWFLRPTAGREGDGFSIYGHGFGATNATYNGHAWLESIQLSETAWQVIAAGTNAYNNLREIDPVEGEPTMEHGRIDVTVPSGATDGMVRVETDI